jgi:hypothetical protein
MYFNRFIDIYYDGILIREPTVLENFVFICAKGATRTPPSQRTYGSPNPSLLPSPFSLLSIQV